MLFKELFRKYIFALYENHPKTLSETEPVSNMDEAMFPKQDNIMVKLSIIYVKQWHGKVSYLFQNYQLLCKLVKKLHSKLFLKLLAFHIFLLLYCSRFGTLVRGNYCVPIKMEERFRLMLFG